MTKTTLILAGLLAAAPMSMAAAQQRSFAGCWLRPAPAPTCRGFIVTEASVEIPFSSTSFNISAGSTEKDFDTRFILSAGYMHNTANGRGVGVVLGYDVDRSFTRNPSRFEGRVRQWHGANTAFDLSAGVSRKGFQNAGDLTGLTAAVGGEWRYIGADARIETYDVNGRRAVGGLVSARATSVAAPVAALLTFGALAALILSTGAGY
jgi:hypothetical protein